MSVTIPSSCPSTIAAGDTSTAIFPDLQVMLVRVRLVGVGEGGVRGGGGGGVELEGELLRLCHIMEECMSTIECLRVAILVWRREREWLVTLHHTIGGRGGVSWDMREGAASCGGKGALSYCCCRDLSTIPHYWRRGHAVGLTGNGRE